jgi:hypothetical protein
MILYYFLNIYQLLWNIENSNQLPQQLKHMRTKFYIHVIPEYRVPWLDIYKYPLPDGEGGSLLRYFVSYQKGLFQYFVKSKWQVWIWFHLICMLLLCLCLFDLCTLFNLYIFLVKLYMPSTLRGKIVHWITECNLKYIPIIMEYWKLQSTTATT